MSNWNPYQPSSTVPWNVKRVVHLHRRVAFGACWDEVQRDVNDTPAAAIDRVLNGNCRSGGVPADFERLSQMIGTAAVSSGGSNT